MSKLTIITEDKKFISNEYTFFSLLGDKIIIGKKKGKNNVIHLTKGDRVFKGKTLIYN